MQKYRKDHSNGKQQLSDVLVVGGARSGLAVCKLLCMHGCRVTLTDMQTVLEKLELEAIGVIVVDGGHPDFLLRKYDLVVKNPGISLRTPFINQLVRLGNEVVCEIDVASRLTVKLTYGAITGTNGKTTTTSLLHAFLNSNDSRSLVAGNIGVPLSQVVLDLFDNKSRNPQMNDNHDDIIKVAIELSSFQLQTMPTFKPFVSVILNLTPDHLDYHNDLDEYYQAKTNIYKNMDENGYFLCNVDDELIMKYTNNGKDIPCQVLYYSMKRDEQYNQINQNDETKRNSSPIDIYRKEHHVYLHDTILFDEREMRLVGEHNVQNAMIAASMAYLMGVSPKHIQQTLLDFSGVEHRLEFVRELHGVKYYNDSKGTNVDAAKIALSSFPDSIVWLAGGKDKNTGYDLLIPCLTRLKSLVVFGEAKYSLSNWARNHNTELEIHMVENLKDATILAHELAKSGDTVLLSPACSSFDQFKNFEERGRVFKECVWMLGDE